MIVRIHCVEFFLIDKHGFAFLHPLSQASLEISLKMRFPPPDITENRPSASLFGKYKNSSTQ